MTMPRYTYTTTDEQQAQRWLRAADLCHVITELDAAMRDAIKYGEHPEAKSDGIAWAREQLTKILSDNDISMERLWT